MAGLEYVTRPDGSVYAKVSTPFGGNVYTYEVSGPTNTAPAASAPAPVIGHKAGGDIPGLISASQAAQINAGQPVTPTPGGIYTAPVQPTPATPSGGTPSNPAPIVTPPANSTRTVKVAEPDIINFDSAVVDSDILALLVFNQIGGIELISTNRSDTINGEIVVYNPITDLRQINLEFNPTNILTNLRAENYFFAKFAINLFTRIPDDTQNIVKIENITNPSIFPTTLSGNVMNFTLNYLNTGEELEIEFIVSAEIDDIGNTFL